MKLTGARPICNKNPSSAPNINGKSFILCWRCIGGGVGGFIMILTTFIFKIEHSTNNFYYFLLAAPAVVDYSLIRAELIRPSNVRRFITGVLLGMSVSIILLIFLN